VSSKTPAKSAIAEKESAKKPAAAPKPAAKAATSAKADKADATVKSAAEAPAKSGAPKATTAKLPSEAPAAVRAHAPTPSTASFTDRFAPPKPPTKTYPEPMNAVKTATKADPKLANAWKTKTGRDLTEAELLAMPESEYMNDKQLEFFRNRLQEQKDALLSNAGETTEHLREDTSIVPDPADRATIEEEHALELRTRDRERKLLKKISQSLARIEAGDYGYCDETGEPIGLGRLLARPTATLSLEAQQRREMKQKMFGD
jgi:DnaK suppressor protein